jgi:hypothetical protein
MRMNKWKRSLTRTGVSAFVMTIAMVALLKSSLAQERALNVDIVSPLELGIRVILFRIDDKSTNVNLASGRGTVSFPDPGEKTVDIGVRVLVVDRTGGNVPEWSTSTKLNGSGHMIYTLRANPGAVRPFAGDVGQWPAITWKAIGPPLDVFMNGDSIGTTMKRRGIVPNQTHTFVWRQNTSTVCQYMKAFPVNSERSLTCDPGTHQVSEN